MTTSHETPVRSGASLGDRPLPPPEVVDAVVGERANASSAQARASAVEVTPAVAMARVTRVQGYALDESTMISGLLLLGALTLVAFLLPSPSGLAVGVAWLVVIGVAVKHRLAIYKFKREIAHAGRMKGLSEEEAERSASRLEASWHARQRRRFGSALSTDQELG